MKTVYSIIQELAATRSGNDKKSILSREIDNQDLKIFFKLALYNQIMFYQKKPISSNSKTPAQITLREAMGNLATRIASRAVTGNDAKEYIANLEKTKRLQLDVY